MSLDFNALVTKVSHIVMRITSYFRSPIDILYVYGGGTVYTDATITAALTAIGSTRSSIKLAPGTWTISNNLTIPANVYIDISVATLSIDSGKTFTVNGLMDDTLNQKFSGEGTVSIGKEVYPEWWGASTSASAAQNKTAIQKSLNCGAARVTFNHLFTVDGAITYGNSQSIKGAFGGLFTTTKGINFQFTATGNTSLFSPTTTSDQVQYNGLYLQIDTASNLGTSNWTIILHNHKGGRFSKMKSCYFYNAKGSDDGAGNYFVVGSKYYYTSSPLAYIFDIWIEHNIWSGFDIDLWVHGDSSVPAQAGLAVGWYIYGNFFSSTNPNNTVTTNGNVRLDDVKQFSFMACSFNGDGMSGGVGFPNIACNGETAHLSLFGNYWEGGPNGRKRIYMNDTTSYISFFESSLSNNEIQNTSNGEYQLLSPYGSHFGGSFWSNDNKIEDENESMTQAATTYTLTASDSGKTIWSNTDGTVITLPATVVGMTFRIKNWGANGTVKLSLSPNVNDKIMGAGVSGTNDKDFINTKATAKYGDSIEVVGDGIDGWYVTKIHGTWDLEA